MNILSIDRLTKHAGDKTLFHQISFGLDEKDKVALVGINGCGKSTLIRMIAGEEGIDDGRIIKSRNLKIGYLPQNPIYHPDQTILQHIFKGESALMKLLREYEELCIQMSDSSDSSLKVRYETLTAEMEQRGAWTYENQVRSLLHRLGIVDLKLKMDSLSGGMLKKVMLAQTLVDDTDLLLLDEPTNHLDADTILWLEEYLVATDRALLFVTHDRYFLESITNRIYEIEEGTLFDYKGSYNFYLERKLERDEVKKKEDAKVKNALRGELEWLKKQPKARGTKSKSRIDRIHQMLDRPVIKENDYTFAVSGRRTGGRILEMINVSKSYGEQNIIEKFTHTFRAGERIGVVGPNGAGKSTLLKLISEQEAPGTGKVICGVNTLIGYFDQNTCELEPDVRVIDFIKHRAGAIIKTADGSEITASRMLDYFLFPPAMQYSPIGKLSGGERRRLYLVYVLMKNPNFLILDEPTNDFDIKTLTLIEDFLLSYKGTLVVVSHDRYFMDRIADYLFVLDGNGSITKFPGNFSDYLEYKQNSKNPSEKKERFAEEQSEKSSNPNFTKQKKKLSNREEREIAALEKEMDSLEKEKSELETFLSAGGDDYEKLAEWGKRHGEVLLLLDEKMLRWDEILSSLA